MTAEFATAKNGERTVRANGILLHSAYNPSSEAEKFTAAVSCRFSPELVVAVEPALSYILPFLRKRFPDALMCAVRLSDVFSGTDSVWDMTIRFRAGHQDEFADRLISLFGEEKLCSALFTGWPPSGRAMEAEAGGAWTAIKAAVEKARTVLITRGYFENRWLLNSCRLIKFVRNTVQFTGMTDLPAVVTASGPDLLCAVPAIKKYRDRIFLICVSSALRPLLSRGITPDLCVSTDGGYWAKKHLECLSEAPRRIPLALPPEAACPSGILSDGLILPLAYSDGPGSAALKAAGITAVTAERNGTVSGTAMRLAQTMTSGRIFMTGLNLSPQKGFQHTQPNAVEAAAAAGTDRTDTEETRAAASGLPSGTLEIYRKWFASCGTYGREIFRVSQPSCRRNSLGKIRDITPEEFESLISCGNSSGKIPIGRKSRFSAGEKKFHADAAYRFIVKESQRREWAETEFPLDALSARRGGEAADAAERRLEERSLELMRRVRRILDGQNLYR